MQKIAESKFLYSMLLSDKASCCLFLDIVSAYLLMSDDLCICVKMWHNVVQFLELQQFSGFIAETVTDGFMICGVWGKLLRMINNFSHFVTKVFSGSFLLLSFLLLLGHIAVHSIRFYCYTCCSVVGLSICWSVCCTWPWAMHKWPKQSGCPLRMWTHEVQETMH